MIIGDGRVLVTGGAGFIGSHLVDALLAKGADVVVFDDLSSGSWKNLEHHKGNRRLQMVEGDILDYKAVTAVSQGARFVFHMATRNVRLSLQSPTVVHDVNTTGTLNVLKAAAGCRVERFLYCSSSEVNGTADIVPMPEDYHFKPETIYGASKLTGEYYAEVFHRAGWLDVVIARPHNNYGPREHYEGVKGEVIPRFILWALAGKPPVIFGDGAQTRDFTYVTETADYLIRLVECDAAMGRTFNVCRGEEVSVAVIARKISELIGLSSPPVHVDGRPSDVLRLFGDASRLRETLGDSPAIGIEEGLRMTINWFRENVSPTPETLASMEPANWSTGSAEPWLSTARRRIRN
ncbi:MAG: SDR family NAD(P)-dependent oxidoreductase [Nitrospinae bacterium]|nr:SDR family NAD(P)-dependent oxidoreductase [Nitrospinota bacterium]MBF0634986.1 SDR family NAD(P)-dependent oxidoreductase [Nitrospinota bacterium]